MHLSSSLLSFICLLCLLVSSLAGFLEGNNIEDTTHSHQREMFFCFGLFPHKTRSAPHSPSFPPHSLPRFLDTFCQCSPAWRDVSTHITQSLTSAVVHTTMFIFFWKQQDDNKCLGTSSIFGQRWTNSTEEEEGGGGGGERRRNN